MVSRKAFSYVVINTCLFSTLFLFPQSYAVINNRRRNLYRGVDGQRLRVIPIPYQSAIFACGLIGSSTYVIVCLRRLGLAALLSSLIWNWNDSPGDAELNGSNAFEINKDAENQEKRSAS
jgi:hypothetical protein